MGEMMRVGSLLSAVASVSLATGLGAQVTPRRADSTCTKYSDGRTECRAFNRVFGDSGFRRIAFRMDSVMEKRAALGLELRSTGTKRDTLGVFVEGVTPKGPAEAAGIVEGDRIAAINGVDLRTSSADTEDSYTSGLASHRLTREVDKLTPGSRVNLRIYSGGRFRDVQVTAGKASDVMRLGNRFNFRMPAGGGMMEFDGPGAMMLGPDMQLMRERMPMIRGQVEPQLREQLRSLPRTIELSMPRTMLRTMPRTMLRSMPRIRTTVPIRAPRIYRVDRGGEELNAAQGAGVMLLDPDDEEFLTDDAADALENDQDFDDSFILDLQAPIEFEAEIEPVSPEALRELVETAARDAQFALKRLAAAGIA
jgi:hypothetical protein